VEDNQFLDSHLNEHRTFSPPESFSKQAAIDAKRYKELSEFSTRDHEQFWAKAAQQLVWQKPFTQTLEWDPPYARWFADGMLNVSETCLDQHLQNFRRNKAAIVWEGENGGVRTLTYLQLWRRVNQLAHVLAKRGIKKGDRVAIYMPLIPEAVVAMLACARMGATHSVVFGGFSAQSLQDRINDAECKAVITADGGYRKGQVVPLKATIDTALKENACPSVKSVFVYKNTENDVPMQKERDFWWHEEIRRLDNKEQTFKPVSVEAEHPLFILYTSGTTGKPKGIVHSTAGYLTQAMATTSWVLDVKDEDIYWCTADVGWITGHTYVVYGPLACGATIFLYEGAPTYPTPDRFWRMIERHHISIFYTAPTAIRTFMRLGDSHVDNRDLSSLRLLGTVGEPINPKAWMWYKKHVGQDRCPIVDTWWQTETGAMMITPLPGAIATPPGCATKPFFGIDMDIIREDGTPCKTNEGGYLIVKKPWPAMARGIWNDAERFYDTYWSQVSGAYFTGDSARRDSNGNYWLMGRIDDVVNVSGHRIGTMEVESAFVSHESVAEAAVVARPDDIKGQAIVAFVTLVDSAQATDETKQELFEKITEQIGSFAKPAEIRFAKALPKTRSGKIMRRLLRELATKGHVTGDITTLDDQETVAQLQKA